MRSLPRLVYAYARRVILNLCSRAASLGIVKGLAISGNLRPRRTELRMTRSLLS
jgi:hypothetical protein